MRGKSWNQYFAAGRDEIGAIHTDDDPAYGWELFGRAGQSEPGQSIPPLMSNIALRRGKWKILHVGPAAGGRPDGKWQLYDMELDPGEIHDLAEAQPSVMEKLWGEWEIYIRETGTIWGEEVEGIAGDNMDFKSQSGSIIGGE